MKFRNYCIMIMGDTNGVFPEISQISESLPNILDAKGVVIATFSSFIEPQELNDYFVHNNRNFFIFDLDKSNSAYHLIDKELNEGLFGFLRDMNDDVLKKRTQELIRELTSTTVENKTKSMKIPQKTLPNTKISLEDIDGMTKKEKENLFNTLLEKGAGNLSEYDKKILNKLATK